jgi:hypothetical protein
MILLLRSDSGCTNHNTIKDTWIFIRKHIKENVKNNLIVNVLFLELLLIIILHWTLANQVQQVGTQQPKIGANGHVPSNGNPLGQPTHRSKRGKSAI